MKAVTSMVTRAGGSDRTVFCARMLTTNRNSTSASGIAVHSSSSLLLPLIRGGDQEDVVGIVGRAALGGHGLRGAARDQQGQHSQGEPAASPFHGSGSRVMERQRLLHELGRRGPE